jgi:carboxymethylenebutenolidase
MPTSSTINLTAEDGHQLNAFQVLPDGEAKGGLVVIQEVFGVNHHVRAVCEQFAKKGYAVIAPSLYDRIEPGVELAYGDDDLAHGRELRTKLGWDGPIMDVAAALSAAEKHGQAGTIGYCWGGSVSWLAATRLQPACAVCYYGAQIIQFKDEQPNCPVLMHFGEQDHLISHEDIAAIREAQPSAEIHTYPDAGHGFNCTERPDYRPDSAQVAMERTLEFFEKHLV